LILVDFSSIVHRKLHTSISAVKPRKEDGKYLTSDYIALLRHNILNELFEIHNTFTHAYGELVVCLDNHSAKYWRKDFYPLYKHSRKKIRQESEVNYGEVFEEVDVIINAIDKFLPYRAISVPGAEADDIMLVLSRIFSTKENILIHSPDKDLIQAQRDRKNVKQYSSLTGKYLVPEAKHDNMQHWVTEHCVLGDPGDNIPRIVDECEFSDVFQLFLSEKGIHVDVGTFQDSSDMLSLIDEFESINDEDVYKKRKYGPATFEKDLKTFGSLDAFLNSNPLYRKHYERNFTLIMEEGIPEHIWSAIENAYKNAHHEFKSENFNNFLNENGLKYISNNIPSFSKPETLTIDNCGW
jgi:5'-3' exonuclease